MGFIGGRGPRNCARLMLRLLIAIGFGFAAGAFARPARALDLSALLAPDIADADWMGGGVEVFAGVDGSDSAMFSYGGLTLAPSGLDSNGLRVRFYAGSGNYTYTTARGTPDGLVSVHRRADILQAEALIGWQVSIGATTAKLFGGIAYEEQTISPDDPENALAGERFGAKLALETWVDLARWAWLSVDASYATSFDAYSGTARLGLKPHTDLSLGPEARAFGDREFDGHRLGGFARWHCGGCDVTISGGVAGDYDAQTGAYGALSFYRSF